MAMRQSLASLVLVVVLGPGLAGAEEALLRDGRRLRGSLQRGMEGWVFRTGDGKTHPLENVQLLRFPDSPAPAPHSRLLHQLVFSGGQRLVGELVKLDDTQVHFRFPSGELRRLARRKVQGVTQVEGYATVFLADKDQREQVFAKTGSIELREGKVQVFFQDAGLKGGAEGKVLFQFAAKEERKNLDIFVNSERSRVLEQLTRLPAGKGRRLLHVDFGNGRAKVFLNDLLLGAASLPKDSQLEAVQLSLRTEKAAEKSGDLVFEDLQVLKKMTGKPRIPAATDQDVLCLETGDQLFGKLSQANDREIQIDARFGQRVYLWSKVQGIFFRPEPKPAVDGKSTRPRIHVRFRSAPGQTADFLIGNLLNLHSDRLELLHEVLGEFLIERKRLERLVFPEPAQ